MQLKESVSKSFNTIRSARVACASLVLAFSPVYADITITQLANEGVIVSDGDTRIIIDGMVVEPYSIYGGLPPEVATQFDQASGAFSEIDLALASHRHQEQRGNKYDKGITWNSNHK